MKLITQDLNMNGTKTLSMLLLLFFQDMDSLKTALELFVNKEK